MPYGVHCFEGSPEVQILSSQPYEKIKMPVFTNPEIDIFVCEIWEKYLETQQ